MAALWNPEILLDIRGSPRISNGIQCNGRNGGYGSRCGWTKGGRSDELADVRGAESLLRTMAVLHPSNITSDTLSILARLCLCRDHHITAAQIDKLVKKWEVAVRQASSIYPTGLATPPATPPRLQSQSSDSDTLVSSQPNPFGAGFGSFSAKSVQPPQHGVADAPVPRSPPATSLVSSQPNPFGVGFGSFSNKAPQQPQHGVADAVVSRSSPAEKRLEEQLAAVQKQLSASQAQEKELLDKMSRLEQLNAEHLRSEGQRNLQLAVEQSKVSTRDFQIERYRQRERDQEVKAEKLARDAEKNFAAVQKRLSALEIDHKDLHEKEQRLVSEHSAWRSQAEEILAATQKKFSVLDIENKDLREKEQHLVSEHSAWRSQMEEVLAATQQQVSALNTENKDLREKEQLLLAEHSAQKKQAEESLTAAQKKLSVLELENRDLHEKEQSLVSELSSQRDQVEEILAVAQKNSSALELENQDLREKEQNLVLDHSAQKNHLEHLLVAVQKQSSALELENKSLRGSEQRLQTLASDLQLAMDRAADRAKSEMGALQHNLAQVAAENVQMKKVGEQKDQHLQALQAQLDALRDDNHQLNAHLQEKIAEVEHVRAEMSGSRILRLRAWFKTKGRVLRVG